MIGEFQRFCKILWLLDGWRPCLDMGLTKSADESGNEAIAGADAVDDRVYRLCLDADSLAVFVRGDKPLFAQRADQACARVDPFECLHANFGADVALAQILAGYNDAVAG